MANKPLFVDTSALFAFFDKSDRHHLPVRSVIASHPILVSSNYVVDEFITLLRARKVPVKLFAPFVTSILEGETLSILRVTERIERKAWDILLMHSDHDLSFTDCASVALMREHGIDTAITLDKHFTACGFSVLP